MADQVAQGKLSPLLQRKRMGAVVGHLRGRVLDVGCGSGALAAFVPPERYLGIDVDALSLTAAQRRFPAHRFQPEMPADTLFDTICALAVIEHVPDPTMFLQQLAARLSHDAESRIVCTTPHPSLGWAHTMGARLGLFSRGASEEHETLLGREALQACGGKAGLRLLQYRRFLAGANQLAVFARRDSL